MSSRNACCCGRSCPANNGRPCRRNNPVWYIKLIKPIAFCIFTSLLAMTITHLCDKYAVNTSLKMIKSDLGNLRLHLNTLALEVRNVMEMRDELKMKLKEMKYVIPKISEAILSLRNEISGDVNTHARALLKALSPDIVREMVRRELQTYDADKTGKADYALHSSGASILTIRNTETISRGEQSLSLFGISICPKKNSPELAIQNGVLPGECWSFKGSRGTVVIKLLDFVYLSGVTIEHVSPLIAPTDETSSAPRDFSVRGLENVNDLSGFFFGEFTYDNSGPPLQYFEFENHSRKAYEIVEVTFHSNSGNRDYTCVYRIRVHGTLHR